MKVFLAELLGTFLLVLLGDGSVAQVVLGNTARSDTFFGGFLNIALGYGLALMVGICASGGVSGGHLNPAVSLAMAVIRRGGLGIVSKIKSGVRDCWQPKHCVKLPLHQEPGGQAGAAVHGRPVPGGAPGLSRPLG